MTVVSKWWSMDRKKPSLFLTNSSIWRHTDWYENQSCSICFDIKHPKVLQKKEVRRGFSGWSCSKKLYNLLSALWSSTNRFLMDGTSLQKHTREKKIISVSYHKYVQKNIYQVSISHAMFECKKRNFSSTSWGGSVTINVTSSSTISARLRLQKSQINKN